MSHTLHYCRSIFKAKIKSRSKVLILVSIWGTCIRFSKGNHQSQAGPLLRPPWNSADNPHWWYRWNVICNTNTNTNTRSRQQPSGHKYKYPSITWLQRRGSFSGHHCGPHKEPSQERFEGFKIYFLFFLLKFVYLQWLQVISDIRTYSFRKLLTKIVWHHITCEIFKKELW